MYKIEKIFRKLHLTNIFFFRDITIEILSDKPVGSFVVRQSRSTPENLALSLRIPTGTISHYLIQTSVSTEGQIFYQIKVIRSGSALAEPKITHSRNLSYFYRAQKNYLVRWFHWLRTIQSCLKIFPVPS